MSTIEVRVCGRYKIGHRIGTGTFGSIYLGKNVQSNIDVAIKVEEIKSRYPQLLYEGKILQNLQGGLGICSMFWCGQEGDYNFLVTELLGQNLEELLSLCKGRFSLKTVLMIAEQIILNIEYLHFKAYIHRDLKPENFLMGRAKNQKKMYTIDFGLSKRYRDSRTYEHIPFREKKPLIGTVKYASINAHKGYELSRRDDLESLGYILIYLLKGNLPWEGVNVINKEEKYNKIKEIKINTTLDELCKEIPPEFKTFIQYCRDLQFDERPDYYYLRQILKERFIKEGYQFDYIYDWSLIPFNNRQSNVMKNIPINCEVISNEDQFIKEYEEMYKSEEQSQEEEKNVNYSEDQDNSKEMKRQIIMQNVNQLKVAYQQQQQQQQQQEVQQQNQIFQQNIINAIQTQIKKETKEKQEKKNDCSIM